jgi:hypothetical protein
MSRDAEMLRREAWDRRRSVAGHSRRRLRQPCLILTESRRRREIMQRPPAISTQEQCGTTNSPAASSCSQLLLSRNQMLDAQLERPVVAFTHDDIDMQFVVVDERLPQR